jgi:glycine betaine/proline transport system permease protein
MAAITSDENEPQPLISPTPVHGEATPANHPRQTGIRLVHKQLAGAAAVLVVFIVCLAVWGAGMGFPTTVSTSEVATTGGGSVTLTKTYRDVSSDAINDAVKWVTREGNWLFGGLKTAVTYALLYIETGLEWLPWPAVVLGLALLSFAVGRWPLTVFTSLALLFAGFMGLWGNMMDTIALMLVAVLLSVGVGFPLGVLAARNRMIDSFMRPVLDGMQTMPSFVYLLPGILFFGLGKPAGIFATIIYAVPPVIRLTNLGIRQVSPETVEAGRSFGASPLQLLVKVQVPMALPTIMAGINQTTMMALAMVTIASLVAAGGLGDNVLRALQKNDSGTGAIAGLTIVFLAIIIDRLTQAAARRQQEAID